MKKIVRPIFFAISLLSLVSCSGEQDLSWPPEFYNSLGFNLGHLNVQADSELEHHIRLLKSNRNRQDHEAFYQYKSKLQMSDAGR